MTPIEREPPMAAPPFDLAIARCTVAAGLTFACATVSDQIAPATQGALERLLDDDERTVYVAIQDQSDRRCYAAARGLLRIELSIHLALAPQDWQYVPKAGHPPEIRTPLGRLDKFRFSVSHTRGLVACTVADSSSGPYGAVGIDVEWVRPVSRSAKLARRHFAPAEVEALRALPRDQRDHRFVSLWALRQAWDKARSCPARPDPRAEERVVFHFDRTGKLVPTTYASGAPDLASRWRFWLHPLNENHVLALAAKQWQLLA
jgi:4'-phosphopantetheinyl transferase